MTYRIYDIHGDDEGSFVVKSEAVEHARNRVEGLTSHSGNPETLFIRCGDRPFATVRSRISSIVEYAE